MISVDSGMFSSLLPSPGHPAPSVGGYTQPGLAGIGGERREGEEEEEEDEDEDEDEDEGRRREGG